MSCQRHRENDVAPALRVVLGEDNYLVREGITRVLEADSGVQVVATAATKQDLLAAIEATDPDVVVTDIRMPPDERDEGIQVAIAVRQQRPRIGVIVLSQFLDAHYVLALFDSGSKVRAYLLKERVHDRKELVSAIHTVHNGGSVIDPRAVDVLIHAHKRASDSPLRVLTPRELDVLREIAQGKSNAAIAASLVISKRAVERHINSVFLKLGLTESTEVSPRVMATLMLLTETRSEPST